MADVTNAHRRSRAWQLRFISRLNACYWKAVLAKVESRSLKIRCGLPVVGFGVTIFPVIFAITWNPAIIAALISLTASMAGIGLTNARANRIKNYCRQWSELSH